MASDPNPDDLRNLWQDQPLENKPMSLDEIRALAARFERRIGRRNLREYVAGLVTVVIFGYYIWHFHGTMMRAGSIMIIAGVLYVMWKIHRHGAASPLPAEMGWSASLDFHRRQLAQQRDMLASVLWWYIAPMVPGLAVFLKGSMRPDAFEPDRLLRTLLFLVFAAGVLVAVWWLNHRAALKLDQQIAELDNLERQS